MRGFFTLPSPHWPGIVVRVFFIRVLSLRLIASPAMSPFCPFWLIGGMLKSLCNHELSGVIVVVVIVIVCD